MCAAILLLIAMRRTMLRQAASQGHLEGFGSGVLSLPCVVPFVILFESSSGSSWLMQLLSAHKSVCAVGFEPIDNISLGAPTDHAARLRWLKLLWTPRRENESAWVGWQEDLKHASIFGQEALIARSLASCSQRGRAQLSAFGLKARLPRLLNDHDSVRGLVDLAASHDVHVIRLTRSNRIKQALAEYNRLRAGRGQFAKASGGGGDSAVVVDLRAFARALRDVERSHRLASTLLERLSPQQPTLSLMYEDLLSRHETTVRAVAAFLRLRPASLPGHGSAVASAPPVGSAPTVRYAPTAGSLPTVGSATLRKATPDRLCEAVANFRELCRAYVGSEYATFFTDGCDAPCANGTDGVAVGGQRAAAATAVSSFSGQVQAPPSGTGRGRPRKRPAIKVHRRGPANVGQHQAR